MTTITEEMLNDDRWLSLAERHINSDWNCDKPDGFLKAVIALALDYRQQVIADLAQRSGRPWPVKAADHPDFVGGVVWSTLELHFLDERDKKWATVVASMKAKLEQSEARVRELEAACKNAWAGFVNLSPEEGPMSRQMRSHAAELDATLRKNEGARP